MSSQVNKSQHRFVPKAAGRGPGRAAPRRLSTLRASFSSPHPPVRPFVSNRDTSTTPGGQPLAKSTSSSTDPANDTDPLGANHGDRYSMGSTDGGVSLSSALEGSAIDDSEPSVLSKELMPRPRASGSIMETTNTKEKKGDTDRTNEGPTITEPPREMVNPTQNEKTLHPPASDQEQSEVISSNRHDAPSTQPTEVASTNVVSTETAAQPSHETAMPLKLHTPKQPAKSVQSHPTKTSSMPMANYRNGMHAPSMTPPIEELEEEPEAAPREKQYDDKGRLIVEPGDLPVLTKGMRGKRADSELEREIANRVINTETFTMAALCKDIPVGMANNDYEKYESARIDRKKRRTRILRAKQMMRGIYEPKDESERRDLNDLFHEYRAERDHIYGRVKKESQEKLQAMDAEPAQVSADGSSNHYNLQLSRDERTGKISVGPTQIDRHENNQAQADDTGKHKVEVNKYSRVINSYTFSTKERPERWTPEETQKFYQALSAWGTDFNLIAHMFPTRTRHQIKTKFKYEERRNAAKIHLYLVHRRTVNLDEYSAVSSTPILDESQMQAHFDQVRDEERRRMEEQELERRKAAEEDARKQQQRPPARRAKA